MRLATSEAYAASFKATITAYMPMKTGVQKHTKTELKLNRSYYEMAEYYGTAVIPCRVRSPRDKGHVEGTVGIISTWIIAAIRNQQFLSLGELNAAIREKLEEFNHKEFKKYTYDFAVWAR